ncbi:hypothetical protein VNI00_011859 [Paramarasmius palmivorus]|uniref:Uncharacterized protein n=1 Tax=Paramarasmius palmivorus TaxID=297713 RepID=A0AAW0C905_9AGAR
MTFPTPHHCNPTRSDSSATSSTMVGFEDEQALWQDNKNRDRRYLSEKGYSSLAVCSTFLAAMQGQVLSLVVSDDGPGSPLVTMLFFLGLLANVFGAILNYQASRWFEMLTWEEVVLLETYNKGFSESKIIGDEENQMVSESPGVIDRWIKIAIASGPWMVGLGLFAFILGLLLYVCITQGLVVNVIIIVFCGICAIFISPFALQHNRRWVLMNLSLERRSEKP